MKLRSDRPKRTSRATWRRQRTLKSRPKRYAILVQKEYVAKDQYDQIRANADATGLRASTRTGPNVENSRLQLSYCTIKSPINGRAGSVLVNAGNIIKANDLALTTINQIVPIYVTFLRAGTEPRRHQKIFRHGVNSRSKRSSRATRSGRPGES